MHKEIEQKNQKNSSFNILLSGYEGPIDLLLDLARKQKVNLSEISILEIILIAPDPSGIRFHVSVIFYLTTDLNNLTRMEYTL